MKTANGFEFTLPDWLSQRLSGGVVLGDAVRDQMAFVLSCVRDNIEQRSGGPFAAAVIEQDGGRVIAAGVNLVPATGCSVLHAEIVAIMLAQACLGSYDLGSHPVPLVLACSAEPCAMCMGAIPWSGIRRVVIAARGEDAEGVGFDEGTKPVDWIDAYAARGIAVTRDVCRAEAAALLRLYQSGGGEMYNPTGKGDSL